MHLDTKHSSEPCNASYLLHNHGFCPFLAFEALPCATSLLEAKPKTLMENQLQKTVSLDKAVEEGGPGYAVGNVMVYTPHLRNVN